MRYVIVYTKARKARSARKLPDERVYLRKKRRHDHERWFGQRWHRGWWIASVISGDAHVFDSVRAARRIIGSVLWCRFARGDGWRASVHVVKEERGGRGIFFDRSFITVEVWPQAQAIDALAAVLG